MRRLIDIDASLEAKIQQIIQSKKYSDFQHFATVALENQVTLETSELNDAHTSVSDQIPPARTSEPLPRDTGYHLQSHTDTDTDLLRLKDLSQDPILLPFPDRISKILWGQEYRFLPSKVGVRVLLNTSFKELPDIHEFMQNVSTAAIPLKHELAKLDIVDKRIFGEMLSASFPTHDPKSMRRFLHHYIIYVRSSDMTLMGMMPELKFLNIQRIDDGTLKVGLTESGKKFALLQNPVIDSKRPESLSPDEIDFLISHMSDNLPEEFEHMMVILKAIKEGKQTRDQLNETLKGYYMQYHNGTQWSDAVVNTMRSGLLSRMNDLKLVRREKLGKNVRYHMTHQSERHMEVMGFV